MNKSVIMVRTGSPIYWSIDGPARGDADTVPLVQELASMLGDSLYVYGALRGITPMDLVDTGVHFRQCPRDLRLAASEHEVAERLEPISQELAQSDPACFIDAFGPTPTWSTRFNPHGASVYDYAMNYSWAMLYVMHRVSKILGRIVPRIGFVTDPKCYKRDGEMSNLWPEIIPAAVLSQENQTIPKKVQGVDYNVVAVDAGCAYWHTRGMQPQKSTREHEYLVAGHTHSTATVLTSARRDLWRELAVTLPEGTVVCGEGWGCVGKEVLSRVSYRGCLPTFDDVYALMRTARCGPMVPQKPGFASTKIRLYALNGCCPCPMGAGPTDDMFSYDREGLVLPLDWPTRWPSVAAFRRGQPVPVISDQLADDTIQMVLDRTRPNFSLLWRLIDDLQHGRSDWQRNNVVSASEDWLNTYGGYVKLC